MTVFGPTTFRPGGPWGYGIIEGLPVSGPISSPFGDPRPGGPHTGMDVAVITGTPILAPAAGTIERVDFTGAGRSGRHVAMKHADGMTSAYYHMSEPSKDLIPGEDVPVGTYLGASGNTGYSTGPHLHWGVFAAGDARPVNPLTVIDSAADLNRGRFITQDGGAGPGITPAVWTGGTVNELAEAARREGAESVTVFADGRPFVLIPGAPGFVNRAIRDHFPIEAPAGTIVFIAK